MHTQTVDTRPFLSEWEGPGHQAIPTSAFISQQWRKSEGEGLVSIITCCDVFTGRVDLYAHVLIEKRHPLSTEWRNRGLLTEADNPSGENKPRQTALMAAK